MYGFAQVFSGWPFYIRFRFIGANVLFDTSPDAVTWTNRATCPMPFVPNNAYMGFAGRFNATPLIIDSITSDFTAYDILRTNDPLIWDAANNRFAPLTYVLGEPADGQTLVWDKTTRTWKYRTVYGGSLSGQAEQDIAWSTITGNMSIGAGNSLDSTSDWNGVTRNGANAQQAIMNVGGYAKVTVGPSSESTRYVGMRTTWPNHNNSTFYYGVQFRGDGTIHAYENGADIVTGVAYANNDVWQLGVVDNAGSPVIKLYQNGVVRATYATVPTFPLYFDAELPFGGAHFRTGKIRQAG
jgi:hypothetical protein